MWDFKWENSFIDLICLSISMFISIFINKWHSNSWKECIIFLLMNTVFKKDTTMKLCWERDCVWLYNFWNGTLSFLLLKITHIAMLSIHLSIHFQFHFSFCWFFKIILSLNFIENLKKYQDLFHFLIFLNLPPLFFGFHTTLMQWSFRMLIFFCHTTTQRLDIWNFFWENLNLLLELWWEYVWL
jgi:hypothetical protein